MVDQISIGQLHPFAKYKQHVDAARAALGRIKNNRKQALLASR